jgi:hypothetical protein
MTHPMRPGRTAAPGPARLLLRSCTLLLAGLPVLAPCAATAQDQGQAKGESVEAIDAAFLKGVMDLERARLQRLDALAKG